MTKRKNKNKKKRGGFEDCSPELMEWLVNGIDGHPTGTPSIELAAEINHLFVREFKKDPMWKNMIEDFGEEKAEEMLNQMCIKGKNE